MQTRYKAAAALGISVLGFAATYPYMEDGFWCGLINRGFLAATIGGLADWFAVTAIFRKPLGIPFHTEILTRNRERILGAIVDFASEDLLSTRNIMEIVRQQNMAQMLAEYLTVRGGSERLKNVLDRFLLQAVRQMDMKAAAAHFEPVLKELLQEIPLEKLFLRFLASLAEKKYNAGVLDAVLTSGQKLLAAPEIQQLLQTNVSILRQRYVNSSAGRSFVLDLLNISDEWLLAALNERLRNWLTGLQRPDSAERAHLEQRWNELLQAISQNDSLEKQLGLWKRTHLEQMSFSASLAQRLEEAASGENPAWLRAVHQFLDDKIQIFSVNQSWQKRYDTFVKEQIEKELTSHHGVITSLVRERLGEFSNTQLVEFVESRVEDDLQMIRINGSIVGSLVGMLLFVVVFCVERLYGG